MYVQPGIPLRGFKRGKGIPANDNKAIKESDTSRRGEQRDVINTGTEAYKVANSSLTADMEAVTHELSCLRQGVTARPHSAVIFTTSVGLLETMKSGMGRQDCRVKMFDIHLRRLCGCTGLD